MQRKITVGILQAVCLLCVLTSNLLAVGPLDIWQWRNPLPQGNKLVGVNYCGGLLVALGNNGTILTSTNLATSGWVQSPMGTNTQSFQAIACGNGMFVVGGSGGGNPGTILTSTDGANWYTQTWTNANPRAINSLAYGAGLFVAACERAEIWTSPDGTNWTQRVTGGGSTTGANGITYHPDFGFVLVGSLGLVMTSADGITWASQNSATTISLNGITFGTNSSGDGIFVVAGSSGLILTSPDGTNWIGQASTITASLKNVAYGPGIGFVAVGSSSSVSWVTASTDGTNWTGGVAVPGNEGLAGVTYAPGMFVTVGYYGMVESSPDGYPTNWVAQTSYIIYNDEYYNAGAWNGTNFVVVGTAGAVVTSTDGITWTSRASAVVTTPLRGVGYGRGMFVAVGDSGVIVTSSDNGTNWAVQSSPLANKLKGIAYGADTFVATGDAGVVLTSPDGTNWTFQTSGASVSLSVAYNAGTFVAVGASGVILTSVDNGTNWAAQSSGQTTDLSGITYGANTFVAVGARNKVLSSPDGTNWTLRTTAGGSSSPSLIGVAYGSGSFVVAGSGTSPILSSPDGINWTTNADPNAVSQRFVVYGADSFVVGGSGGILIQASASLPQILINYASGVLTLPWSGGGTLQAAPVVTGPYTNVPGALSPYTIPSPTEPNRFFRVRLP
jgi:hypothetical protein